jgi:hypothetical protein
VVVGVEEEPRAIAPTYAHVIRNDDDRVQRIVDETLGGPAEDRLRTEVV